MLLILLKISFVSFLMELLNLLVKLSLTTPVLSSSMLFLREKTQIELVFQSVSARTKTAKSAPNSSRTTNSNQFLTETPNLLHGNGLSISSLINSEMGISHHLILITIHSLISQLLEDITGVVLIVMKWINLSILAEKLGIKLLTMTVMVSSVSILNLATLTNTISAKNQLDSVLL